MSNVARQAAQARARSHERDSAGEPCGQADRDRLIRLVLEALKQRGCRFKGPVLAEHRNIGLYPLLVADIHRRAVANGYTRGELSWTLEDNHSVNAGIVATGGSIYKKYRLYEKSLG